MDSSRETPEEREQKKMEEKLKRARNEPEPPFVSPEVADWAVRKLMRQLGTPVDRGVSMVLDVRVAAYFKQVCIIDANKSLDSENLMTHLYNACKPLVIELSQAGLFPPMVITTEGPYGAVVPKKWIMEVKKQSRAEMLMLGVGMRELSAIFFHETRHIEQIWMEVQLRKQRGQQAPRIMKDTGLPEPLVQNLLKVPLPEKADTVHMVKLIELSAEARKQNYAIIQKFLAISGQIEGLSLAAVLGDNKAQQELVLLKQQGEAIEKLYKAIPDEADAFAAQDYYETYYDEQKAQK